jgi:transcriptional regulator with XRE-family HTH domain
MANKVRPDKLSPIDASGFVVRLRTLVSTTTQARFAAEAGVSPAWLSEILSGKSEPSMTTLVALAKAGRVSTDWLATGRPVPVAASLGGGIGYGDAGMVPTEAAPPSGLAEPEALAYAASTKGSNLDRAIAAFIGGLVAEAWQLRTRALELAGYLPGDIVVVDRNLEPRPGDVVVAQTEAARPRDVARADARVVGPVAPADAALRGDPDGRRHRPFPRPATDVSRPAQLLVALAALAVIAYVFWFFWGEYRKSAHADLAAARFRCAGHAVDLAAAEAGRPNPDSESVEVLRLAVASCRNRGLSSP